MYTKTSLPKVYFKNLFTESQLLFNYFYTTLSPAAVRCFNGFSMHAKEEGFAKDGVCKAWQWCNILCILDLVTLAEKTFRKEIL